MNQDYDEKELNEQLEYEKHIQKEYERKIEMEIEEKKELEQKIEFQELEEGVDEND